MPTSHVRPGDAANLEDISNAILKSKKVIVVTGAGISTNSGIPDFRSENGLYSLIQAHFDAVEAQEAASRKLPSSRETAPLDSRPEEQAEEFPCQRPAKRRRLATEKSLDETLNATNRGATDDVGVTALSDHSCSANPDQQPNAPSSHAEASCDASQNNKIEANDTRPVKHEHTVDAVPLPVHKPCTSVGRGPIAWGEACHPPSDGPCCTGKTIYVELKEHPMPSDDELVSNGVRLGTPAPRLSLDSQSQSCSHDDSTLEGSVILARTYAESDDALVTENDESNQNEIVVGSLPISPHDALQTPLRSASLIGEPPTHQATPISNPLLLSSSSPLSSPPPILFDPYRGSSPSDNSSQFGSSTSPSSEADESLVPSLSHSTSFSASQGSSTARLPNIKGRDLFDASIWSDPTKTSVFYTFATSLRQRVRDVEPTSSHYFISHLRDRGKLVRCYTQNIDQIEEKVGLCTELNRGPGQRSRFSTRKSAIGLSRSASSSASIASSSQPRPGKKRKRDEDGNSQPDCDDTKIPTPGVVSEHETEVAVAAVPQQNVSNGSKTETTNDPNATESGLDECTPAVDAVVSPDSSIPASQSEPPASQQTQQAPPSRGVECVFLHGSLESLRCFVCRNVCSWDSDGREMETLSGRQPECPHCAGATAKRRESGKRALGIGKLRPDIVLYGEEHPNSHLISPIVTHDLSLGPDLLLILGTSLRVHGLKVLVREFAKAVHNKGGKVVFINLTKPPESSWGEIIDYWVEWDCDAWVADVKSRIPLMWLPPGTQIEEPKKPKKAKKAKETQPKEKPATTTKKPKVPKTKAAKGGTQSEIVDKATTAPGSGLANGALEPLPKVPQVDSKVQTSQDADNVTYLKTELTSISTPVDPSSNPNSQVGLDSKPAPDSKTGIAPQTGLYSKSGPDSQTGLDPKTGKTRRRQITLREDKGCGVYLTSSIIYNLRLLTGKPAPRICWPRAILSLSVNQLAAVASSPMNPNGAAVRLGQTRRKRKSAPAVLGATQPPLPPSNLRHMTPSDVGAGTISRAGHAGDGTNVGAGKAGSRKFIGVGPSVPGTTTGLPTRFSLPGRVVTSVPLPILPTPALPPPRSSSPAVPPSSITAAVKLNPRKRKRKMIDGVEVDITPVRRNRKSTPGQKLSSSLSTYSSAPDLPILPSRSSAIHPIPTGRNRNSHISTPDLPSSPPPFLTHLDRNPKSLPTIIGLPPLNTSRATRYPHPYPRPEPLEPPISSPRGALATLSPNTPRSKNLFHDPFFLCDPLVKILHSRPSLTPYQATPPLPQIGKSRTAGPLKVQSPRPQSKSGFENGNTPPDYFEDEPSRQLVLESEGYTHA